MEPEGSLLHSQETAGGPYTVRCDWWCPTAWSLHY